MLLQKAISCQECEIKHLFSDFIVQLSQVAGNFHQLRYNFTAGGWDIMNLYSLKWNCLHLLFQFNGRKDINQWWKLAIRKKLNAGIFAWQYKEENCVMWMSTHIPIHHWNDCCVIIVSIDIFKICYFFAEERMIRGNKLSVNHLWIMDASQCSNF